MTWREHFGLDPEHDVVHPGHNRGVVILLCICILCVGAYIYGAWKGI